MTDNGRPAYSEEEYKRWLNLMTPFLVAGNSLSYAIVKCGLTKHRTTLYEKLRKNDWFSDKIHDFQNIPGELANETFYLLIRQINKKVRAGEDISPNDTVILKHFSERHRSSQQFFTNRQEVVQTEPNKIAQIIDELDKQGSDYDNVALMAGEQLKKLNGNLNV